MFTSRISQLENIGLIYKFFTFDLISSLERVGGPMCSTHHHLLLLLTLAAVLATISKTG